MSYNKDMPDVYKAPKKPITPIPVVDPAKQEFTKDLQQSKDWWKVVVDQVLEAMGEYPRSAVLGAYNVRPGHRFFTQQEDEEVILLLRAHPITNVGWVLLTILMLILPMALELTGIFKSIPGGFMFVGKTTWYLMAFAYSFEKFLFWYYSVFIITNERLVDIDFYNFMFRVITYANLNHIEEPASVTGGFVRSVFQYGNVWVTTASEKPTVEALGVPYPDKVVDLISRLSEELEKRREQGK